MQDDDERTFAHLARRRVFLVSRRNRRLLLHSTTAAPNAQPAPTAAAVQMAAMAVALLDHVTHPRQNVGDAGGGDDHPAAAEECTICLGQFEDGDRCSVMPGCRHEFHRSCITKWLTANNNTCPLCRGQLEWIAVTHDHDMAV